MTIKKLFLLLLIFSNLAHGTPSNGVPGLFPHAKSLGFPLQSSLPVRLWIKTHPKQIAAAAVAGVAMGAAGYQYWKQYGKRHMQPSTSTERPRIVPQEPEGEAQARSSSEPAAAAAGGAPMPPEDPEDPPSDSESDESDEELRDNESDSDEESDCPASCPNQFNDLNDALMKEQYTSIVECTKHGLQRLMERFDPREVESILRSPDAIRLQRNGAQVFIKKLGDKYGTIVISNRNNKAVTGIKMGARKLLRLSRRYGWAALCL